MSPVVHFGSRQEEGVIRYSTDTLDKGLALITARTRDAVVTFLSPDYLRAKVSEIERQAGVPVRHPEETVRQVAKTANQLHRPGRVFSRRRRGRGGAQLPRLIPRHGPRAHRLRAEQLPLATFAIVPDLDMASARNAAGDAPGWAPPEVARR
jgi:hypothetical protein